MLNITFTRYFYILDHFQGCAFVQILPRTNGSRTVRERGPFANAGARGTSTTNERRTVRERFANGANERFRAPRSKPFHASRFMQAVSCSLGGREECPEPLGQPNNSLIRAHDGAAVLGVTGTRLSPGIEVSRPIEATSRPHRGQHRDSVDAQTLSIEAGKSHRG